jgi:hypothetical protein
MSEPRCYFFFAFFADFFLAAFLAGLFADFFATDFFAAADLPAVRAEDFLPVVALAIMVSPDDRLSSIGRAEG